MQQLLPMLSRQDRGSHGMQHRVLMDAGYSGPQWTHCEWEGLEAILKGGVDGLGLGR